MSMISILLDPAIRMQMNLSIYYQSLINYFVEEMLKLKSYV